VSTNENTGKAELLGDLHQTQCLAVALGPRHPEVARRALLGVATLLMAEHHAGLAVEARQAADDRLVVGERAVAVQLLEVGEHLVDVVERVRALRMACDLRHLPGRQARIDVLGEEQALLAQPVDLLGDVDRRLVLHVTKLFDLRFELGDGLLEIEEVSLQHQ
jgi:hypothetical protein